MQPSEIPHSGKAADLLPLMYRGRQEIKIPEPPILIAPSKYSKPNLFVVSRDLENFMVVAFGRKDPNNKSDRGLVELVNRRRYPDNQIYSEFLNHCLPEMDWKPGDVTMIPRWLYSTILAVPNTPFSELTPEEEAEMADNKPPAPPAKQMAKPPAPTPPAPPEDADIEPPPGYGDDIEPGANDRETDQLPPTPAAAGKPKRGKRGAKKSAISSGWDA